MHDVLQMKWNIQKKLMKQSSEKNSINLWNSFPILHSQERFLLLIFANYEFLIF